jgi:Fe2+ transport system protein FeoA
MKSLVFPGIPQTKAGAFVTLADMKPGQTGRIEAIDASQSSVIRLMVLGLVEEVPLRVENVAIGGDPIEISIFGSSISIRKQDARFFEVSLDSMHG